MTNRTPAVTPRAEAGKPSLLEPHGFEGSGFAAVHPDRRSLAVAPRSQVCKGHRRVHVAGACAKPETRDSEDSAVRKLVDPFWLELHPLERLVGMTLPFTDALMPDEDACDWRVGRVSPLDVGVKESKDSVDCLAVVGVERLAHELYVLPRHRLLLQPHGFEGLVRV